MEEYNDDEITKPWKDRIVKYFVYIIESPSLGDMEEGLTEGKALANALKFLKIRCSYNFVPDKRNFFNTFQNLLDCDLMKNNSKPIIHIIAHGCEGAIGLIDDSFIFWDELKNALIPISKALNNNYLLCISACKGFYFIKEAYYDENGNMPFNAFVSSSESPFQVNNFVAFINFYVSIFHGSTVREGVELMNIVSGDDGYRAVLGTNAAQVWEEFAIEQNISNE